MTQPPTVAAVLAAHSRVVEVGIGARPDVAAALAERGCAVTATDIEACTVPETVRFVRDDVTDPERAVYEAADAVYALRCPPELQRAVVDVAGAVGAACYLTTLGGEPVVVPVSERRTVASGALFVARDA
ncbi:UPF0146 family protein [Halobacterium salinarum]|uniref:UPF0146 protein VNG_2609C n=4 Tax=Halobacterium salinarum TaxID=2242 RepID=Y2609_HALSA|nr:MULTISPECIES: UPF0146 family protein [Halobacterium]B0R888.1 RecName: Full=UPF0146 protein OE_4661R [Halobacterium salinarum R1]P58015.1 RecName: Full=UPF0146 protein VNG_2609C [Halobacterium salinarum NRC-1]MBB6089417.1 hypothetical protein [Halobacterium salinarum]MCF2164598.1 hypothetical protein [Halobacterium salinarum]MCF2166956.1 hypothetical protein [Halobacterium salinarum]MCF2238072.1 hypothetical protein [Halobacterium salinarum]MDL0119258.1 UPF0146 family protein [Halobacteriu